MPRSMILVMDGERGFPADFLSRSYRSLVRRILIDFVFMYICIDVY